MNVKGPRARKSSEKINQSKESHIEQSGVRIQPRLVHNVVAVDQNVPDQTQKQKNKTAMFSIRR